MIPAEHKKWADWIFQHYLYWLLKRHFYAIHLFHPIPCFNPKKPLLLLPNHSSWWDGFFIYVLNKKILHRKVYLMMLEEQLKENRFFRFLGAYSIKSDSYRDVKDSVEYTINLLNKKEAPPLVCFFPQGELLRWHTRPMAFKRGLEFIVKNIETEINVCFLGIRIEFLGEQRPEVFIQFSSVRKINNTYPYSQKELESEFETFLDLLETKIVDGIEAETIFTGKKSINEQFQSCWKRRS